MSSTDIRPRAFYTQWFLGSDGTKALLCSYHLRKRQLLGTVEYEPEDLKPRLEPLPDACEDCKERERAQGDAYDLPLSAHYESLATNCDVIWYALSDILSTLEIAADKMKESEHVEAVERIEKELRPFLDKFDTGLNERWCIASRFNEMLDDDGNEAIREVDYEDDAECEG
jgi:hypothetical protein